jgi:putative exosortase-associated protein (TIGR04073 family)
MKTLLSLAAISLLSASAFADIQDPPMNDQGPTRKLGRGFANMAFCLTELGVTCGEINEREGNSAAWSYGAFKGAGRVFFRFGVGAYEFFTFPFPTNKGTYKPPYRSNVPWIHGGYEEFPPELGFVSHYNYVRNYGAY